MLIECNAVPVKCKIIMTSVAKEKKSTSVTEVEQWNMSNRI